MLLGCQRRRRVAELIEKLRGLNIVAIGIEASGGYERGIVRALLAAGFSVRLINPFKLRQFAKRVAFWPKTIGLMRAYRWFVATMPTRPTQRNMTVERMAELWPHAVS